MPDARISELPLATTLGDTDIAPLVQASGATTETRRATLAQLRGAVLADRGAHVRDYGAKGDGTTDDGPAIQAAIDDLKTKGGGTLYFGPRIYRIASAVVLNGATVRLQGAGFTEGPGPGQGTWLRITTTGFTPFTFTGANSRGAGISDIAVQQTHSATQNSSWAPTAYDYVFRVEDCLGGVDFDNIFLCNINKGIYCRNSGRLDIRRLRGQVFTTGVEIDECLDVPRIHSLHFWTFWTSNVNVIAWQQANGDAMIFRRCDGVFIDQAFVLGYRSMFRFGSSAAGVTTKFYIAQAYADFVKYGVWVEASGTDGQIASFTSQNEIFAGAGVPVAGSSAIQVDGSNTRVQVGNLRIDAVEDNPLRVNGTGNRMDIFALRCLRYNTRSNGAAAIQIADSGAGTPNAVYLGSPALLEPGSGGLLVNSGTNAILATGAPAGKAANPGLTLGSSDTGLFLPSSGSLAGSAGGTEVLRATSSGGITLGAAPGGHALEVATPVGTVNRLLISGGTIGAALTVQAQGSDASIGITLTPKGSGLVRAVTPTTSDNSTAVATTAYVKAQAYLVTAATASLADGTSSAPGLGFAGNAGTGLSRQAAGGVSVSVNGLETVRVAPIGSAVNRLGLYGSATGTAVAVLAEGNDTNIGAVVSPKGTGALSGALPDSTATGGNARGANAVDWQTIRAAATQVASAATSVIGGGTTNTASGASATVAGGSTNTASGATATISGGQSNTASGSDAVVGGGNVNTADGSSSCIPGGNRAAARATYGKFAFASGRFVTNGDAQIGKHVLRRQTTDATVTRLTSDGGAAGAANSVTMPNSATFRLSLTVVARQTAGTAGTAGDSASWEADVMMKRAASAATTTLLGGRTVTSAPALAAITAGTAFAPGTNDAGAAAWRLTLDADTTNGCIAISGTGEANKTINWVVRVMSVEAVG